MNPRPRAPAILRRTLRGLLAGAAACAGLLAGQAAPAADPRWFDADRPNAQALQAVELLGAAADQGLEPADYQVDTLRRAVAQAVPDEAAATALAQALDWAMVRYLSDLHGGRVDPKRIHHDFTPPRRGEFDAPARLQAALAARRLPEAVREAAPPLPLYEALRSELARYRTLAPDPAWQQALPGLPGARAGRGGKLTPGMAYAGTALLTQRLSLLGDLPGSALPGAGATGRLDPALVEAVQSFQQRHGLTADGVIGAATLAQLQFTPAARVRQIELSLERLRWTPLTQAARMVVVNIPEFVLRAYEVHDGRIEVRHEMKVVVGKALDTRTPLFDEDMRFIEFSPYWNVPPSIARAELVPRLRREPGHWGREGFEFVAADGSVHTALSAAGLDAVLAGQSRIRQRPGPRNALGDIKFVFPNQDHIYLHHTPSTGLFTRDRRDFSHGCIRVEQPVALATFVLAHQPGWTEARIREAMERGESRTLRLDEPLPVLIAYGTALVKHGRIHFFDDLYGLDRLLDAALRRPRPPAP
ncbi:murein L,D-transpeptidase YcbB/YkuD [Sphaerotilus hippei]|uniref:Murein L,D-transpeptidase YcbB/YkuD n=1 Tax=Sphaerotilus hippei TaxID=744406 RepID=A0A318H644_9BURK|nr:L,D-transpeptidase family protein [Sphaerotilus hippei]PXW99444.1 murein L,D-transpeptidase YcbB/YkuD [Sphaerotilus hippei]